jgi:transposase-like protein
MERSAERREPGERSGADLSLPTGRASEPEVASVARRRRFSKDYKLRILREADLCSDSNEIALVLRREGLYSHHLYRWRVWRREMSKKKDDGTKEGTSLKVLRNENARLKRLNRRLELKLKKAEALLELQKKASEILRMSDPEESESD